MDKGLPDVPAGKLGHELLIITLQAQNHSISPSGWVRVKVAGPVELSKKVSNIDRLLAWPSRWCLILFLWGVL